MERNQIRDHEPFWRWLAKSFAMPALLATPARNEMPVPPPRLDQAVLAKLTALLGAGGIRLDNGERARHAAGDPPDVVLYPRHAEEVAAILEICANGNVAATVSRGARGTRSLAVLDLANLNRVSQMDLVSGLVEAETGVTGPELAHQLAARGVGLAEDFESSLGSWIARGGSATIHNVRLATPRGALTLDRDLMPLAARGLGVITSATLRLRALPEKQDHRAWIFRDFAAGLAALREGARAGLSSLRLCDDGTTRFARAAIPNTLKHRLFDALLAFRGFDGGAVRLVTNFSGSDREMATALRAFTAIARRLGAQADPLWRGGHPLSHYAAPLRERGATMESLTLAPSWSELPLRYAQLRAGLKLAMRSHAALPGAHGLVLAEVTHADAQGARLTLTWAYPRRLEDEMAQADAIARAVQAAVGAPAEDALKQEMLRAIRQTLDPKNVLGG
jgi:alkyldihydroxyacetonephosphate synthase